MKKSIILFIIKFVAAICFIYFTIFFLCKYIEYHSDKEIYLLISSNNYGITDKRENISKANLAYFDGAYIRTKYRSINEIKEREEIITVSMSDEYCVDELYIVYPQMRVFVLYNEFIYEIKQYSDSLLHFLQRLYNDNIE